MTGTGLRIASASAAIVVSAAVAAAALYGGSAISDPDGPRQDERLIAVPAAPSAYPSTAPSPADATTSSGPSRTQQARPHSRLDKCNVHQKGSTCYRPLKSRATARPIGRTNDRRSEPTTAKRRTSTTKQTESIQSTPTKKKTQSASSAPSKTTSSSSSYATRSDWANAVLVELNAERANHGLPALKMNSKLVDAAHTHNLAMAKANTLSHQLSGEASLGSRISAVGYRWGAVGENIAYNSDRSQSGVLAVQKAMYNEKPPDDGHRRNILNNSFVDVGIDVINDSAHGKVWLVTDFGKP
ncbi:MAG TPA: CAP domain-containing protein [Propionibacteriaceae bacterium]|nr:CAP domain-containing protein [Propionibacteriaceae bacterium]